MPFDGDFEGWQIDLLLLEFDLVEGLEIDETLVVVLTASTGLISHNRLYNQLEMSRN